MIKPNIFLSRTNKNKVHILLSLPSFSKEEVFLVYMTVYFSFCKATFSPCGLDSVIQNMFSHSKSIFLEVGSTTVNKIYHILAHMFLTVQI